MTLLGLDNVEPGLDAEELLDTLAAPDHITLLMTARHPVSPGRLTTLELPPLPDPDGAALFKQRLQQTNAQRPTAADTASIPALVADVGGLPLAIELTAAYAGIQHLSLDAVRSELAEDGLSAAAFQQDPKKAPAARFERSWRALTDAQRRLFGGLSLLACATFPRAAAAALAVAARSGYQSGQLGEDHAGTEAAARTDLAALVALALVEALAGERLRLHPLLRDFASGKLRVLGPGVEGTLGDADVAYWLVYANAHPGYEGMAALEAEAPGIMGAMDWACHHDRPRAVLALARTVNRAWYVRGMRVLALQILDCAIRAAEGLAAPTEEMWARHSMALTQASVGNLDTARAGYERALELARQLGDLIAERAELQALAVLNAQQGRPAEARAGYERALELARQLGDVSAEQTELHALAVRDAQQGRVAEARAGYERALTLARRLGDVRAEQAELHALAVRDFSEGDLLSARTRYEQALALAQQLGEPATEQTELQGLADTIRHHGEGTRARDLLMQALAISERLGNLYEIGNSHKFLGRLDEQEGKRADAIGHYHEALKRFKQVGSPDVETMRAALRQLGADP